MSFNDVVDLVLDKEPGTFEQEGAEELAEEIQEVDNLHSNSSIQAETFMLYSISIAGMEMHIRTLRNRISLIERGVVDYLEGRLEKGFDGVEIVDIMNMDKLVNQWTECIIDLCMAHDKAKVDKAEYELEDLISPLITCPGKQLKEFWTRLREALENDERCPFFVYKVFGAWEKGIVQHIEKEGVVNFKQELAAEIARLIEQDVKPDIMTAIQSALMWRSQAALQEIKEEIKGGKKAKLVGRESCLFLEVGDKRVML